jgi:hypothetical protein
VSFDRLRRTCNVASVGAPAACTCSVMPRVFYPRTATVKWDIIYGTGQP